MSPILLRYIGLALIAVIFGGGGGYLAVNNKHTTLTETPSGTTVAIPAQPFPGQGIRAIPAVPAQPDKGKPDVGNPLISYIQGEADKNQVVNPMQILSAVTPFLDGRPYLGEQIVGKNFSETKNAIYWDGRVLVRDIPAIRNSDGTQEIHLPVPTDAEMGSYHSVYVMSAPGGKTNAVQVQVVEHFDIPALVGITPQSGWIGTNGKAKIWNSWEFSSSGLFESEPLSKQLYLGFSIPADRIKSGAEGYTNIFIPAPLSLMQNQSWPNDYSFTVPSELVYCPLWGWDAKDCTLASPNTMIPIEKLKGIAVTNSFYLIYNYKYRSPVKGMAYYQELPYVPWYGQNGPWTDPNGTLWFSAMKITP